MAETAADADNMVTKTETTVTTVSEDDGDHSFKSTVTKTTTVKEIKRESHGTTTIISNPGMESRDNPFLADGELSKKADYILEHSLISRSEVRISDPDLSHETSGVGDDSMIQPQTAGQNQSAPPGGAGDGPKTNGKMEEGLTPQTVTVDVDTANASPPPQTQEPENVKDKDKPKDKAKCKCCVIQ